MPKVITHLWSPDSPGGNIGSAFAAKETGSLADKDRMTISGAYGTTVPDNLANGEAADTQVQVALLKKAQDQMKQQGEAMIRMIDQTPTGGDQFHLDVYA